MEYLAACIFIALFFIWLCSLVLHPAKNSRRNLPPGPRPVPLFGNIFQLGPKPHHTLIDLARLHGPVMSLKFGLATTVIISSPAAAKQVLKQHDQVLSGRPFIDASQAGDLVGNTFVWGSATLPKWKFLKRLCSTQIFSQQKLDSTETLRRRKVDELLHYLDQCSAQGRPVLIGQVIFTAVFNIISNTLFSVDLANYDGSVPQKFMEIISELIKLGTVPNLSDLFPALRVFDIQGIRKRTGVLVEEFFGLLDEIILERSRTRVVGGAGANKDVLDCLLDLKDRSELTREEINSFLMELIIASETTETTIEWALAELLKNPEKMAKARYELDQTLKRGCPMQESDIPNLPYLEAVIKEVLRMHSVFLLPHKAESDVEVCGFMVPKDTQVLINVLAISQDESLWSNPNRFEPERFLERRSQGREFEFIPFGAGRRMCPGQPMAWRMLPFLLGSILQSFEWKLVNGETPESLNMDDKMWMTMAAMAKPLLVLPLKL